MAGYTNFPGQISADDILDSGTGMTPVIPADSGMFVPLQIVAPISTNPVLSETPENNVTIKYMSPTGLRVTHVLWCEGMTVELAFRTARSQDSIFRLLHQPIANYTRKINGLRVRLNYRMKSGDVLQLSPSQSMS